MKKRLGISLIFCCALIFLLALPAFAAPRVLLDGNPLTFDVSPIIEQGRVLVPMRAIFENLGADIAWDGKTKTVTAVKGSITVKLTIGVRTAYKNGAPVTLDVPAKILNSRTLIPLRFVSEALGASVDWDGKTKTVTINSYTWSVTQKGNDAQIAYGKGMHFPQYAFLDLSSSYFRIVAPGCTWGTSIILFPSFWEDGIYHQGDLAEPLSYEWHVDKNDLVLSINGRISNLTVEEEVRIHHPQEDSISAEVSANVSGNIKLDNRPGEAFKPVMLSSMHISEEEWDARSAFVGSQELPIPESGWIIQPSKLREESKFGLKGGKSKWQEEYANLPAPSIEICLEEPYKITGWATKSKDPNDDNIGFWAASDNVIHSWRYTIIAANR